MIVWVLADTLGKKKEFGRTLGKEQTNLVLVCGNRIVPTENAGPPRALPGDVAAGPGSAARRRQRRSSVPAVTRGGNELKHPQWQQKPEERGKSTEKMCTGLWWKRCKASHEVVGGPRGWTRGLFPWEWPRGVKPTPTSLTVASASNRVASGVLVHV